MIFSSTTFIFAFLPVTLLGYYLLGSIGRAAAAVWLVGASLVFYGYWNPSYLVLLIASIAWNFGMGAWLFSFGEEGGRPKLLVLWAAVGGNLALLAYYKYLFPTLGFFAAHHILPPSWESHVVLPLGISFFTFTQIGYLIDSYDGQAKERGLLSYALFVTFFPHLIAGPILHNREMMPQFANRETYRFNIENLATGSAIFIFGITKKVLLADPLGFVADTGFLDPSSLGALGGWVVALSYSLQLYFDFSGYSDMAIGIARMFGITFPANFNSPYKARSVIEFWSRWHITLTRYLTLYLYNPVALRVTRARMRRGLKTTKKATRNLPAFASMVVLPTFFTMGLAGVWHGAGLQFLIFGLLHAIYLSANHAWRIFGPQHLKSQVAGAGFWLLTYACVLVGQIFFRAGTATDAIHLLASMAGLHGLHAGLPVGVKLILRIGLCYAICLLLPNTQQIMRKYRPILEQVDIPKHLPLLWQPSAVWGAALGVLFLIALTRMSDVSKFLYFQF